DLGDALHERPAFPGDRTRIPRAGKDAGDEFGRESQLEQRADRDDGTHSGIVELAVPVGAALRLQQPGLLVVADRPWARTGLATELSDSHGIPPSDLTLTSASQFSVESGGQRARTERTEMKIFLTGGTGYVGSVLLEHLIDAGHDVEALTRSTAGAARLTEAGAS